MTNRFMLVSFCNQAVGTSSPLLYLELPSDTGAEPVLAPVPLGIDGLTSKATGLASHDDRIFAICSGERGHTIAVLSARDLKPLAAHTVPEVADAHSIFVSGNNLYVVSTGTDEVFSLEILDDGLGAPRLVWQASIDRQDTHHVNSVVEFEGDLIVSAFGPRTGRLWDTATNGYLHNITRDVRLKEGIAQPHTLTVHNGRLYYCESRTGAFCSLDSPMFTLPGYTRGAAWLSKDLVAVATSIGRQVSRSTGIYANPNDPGTPLGACAVTLFDLSSNYAAYQLDVSWFGPETYDILPLEASMDARQLAISAQLSERIAIGELCTQLDQLQQEARARSAQISRLQQTLQAHAEWRAAKDLELGSLTKSLQDMQMSRSWKTGQMLARAYRFLLAIPIWLQRRLTNLKNVGADKSNLQR